MTSPQPDVYERLTVEQQALYDAVVERAEVEVEVAVEGGGDGDLAAALVAALASYAGASSDTRDVEAVRFALFGPWRPTSGEAVASLVVGLVTMFLCPIPLLGLVAVALGRRAQRQTRYGIKSGHGMTVAGIALGWISAVIWTAVVGFYVILGIALYLGDRSGLPGL